MRNIQLSLIAFNVTIIFAEVLKMCQQGCLKCYNDSNTNKEVCQECFNSYIYNEAQQQCIKQECELYQYATELNAQKSCTSSCTRDSMKDETSKQCLISNNCSIQFSQPTFLSRGRDIQSVLFDEQGYVQVLYSNFINKIDSQDGSFIRNYSFDSSIILVKGKGRHIFLLGSDSKVYLQDFQAFNPVYLDTISEGIVNSKGEVLNARNNKNKFFITSYSDQQKRVIFTEVLSSHKISLNFVYENFFTIVEDYIISINNSKQIIINYIHEDKLSQIKIKSITSEYVCSNLINTSPTITYLVINNQQTFFIAFSDLVGVRVVKENMNICQLIMSSNIPIKIQTIQQEEENGIKSYLIAYQQINTLQILQLESSTMITSKQLSDSFLDFTTITINNNEIEMYFLAINRFLYIESS